ncbi:glycosyltransferase [Rhizobium sp. RAF56]|uniref:glycosyltransferase n=1 Tax=Rhizobium sp. RAF56 TaxID=3233062 RepID=UPI003F95EAC5
MNKDAMGLSANLVGILRRISAAKNNWQARMRVESIPERTIKPIIYFLTPDYHKPSGGIKVIYRHVDILNSAGIDAFVLHQRRGFRCTWFNNNTRVAYAGNTRVRTGDILVVPEICVEVLDRLAHSINYVLFNQGVHLTWRGRTHTVARHYSRDSGLLGVVTVSNHSQEMLRYAFGDSEISRVHVAIDSDVFHPVDGPRANRIAFMPRRMPEDAHQVFELLRGRGALVGWEIVPLDSMSEAEVAAQLRTTKIFLALAYQEGFGLPPAEAMACGNYVVGYHGFGGRELYNPDFSVAVETGDIVGFARALEYAMTMENAQPGWCQERGKKAACFVQSEYSLQREREEVTQIYAEFLEEMP